MKRTQKNWHTPDEKEKLKNLILGVLADHNELRSREIRDKIKYEKEKDQNFFHNTLKHLMKQGLIFIKKKENSEQYYEISSRQPLNYENILNLNILSTLKSSEQIFVDDITEKAIKSNIIEKLNQNTKLDQKALLEKIDNYESEKVKTVLNNMVKTNQINLNEVSIRGNKIYIYSLQNNTQEAYLNQKQIQSGLFAIWTKMKKTDEKERESFEKLQEKCEEIKYNQTSTREICDIALKFFQNRSYYIGPKKVDTTLDNIVKETFP